jgi:hypothetical protein
MGDGRKVYRVFVGKPEENRPLGRRGVDERMKLEWILGRLTGGGGWSEFTWLRIGKVGGL